MKHDCTAVQERMMELLFVEKAPPDEAALEREIQTCPDCRREWESLSATRAVLDQRIPARPRDGFLEDLKTEVRRQAASDAAEARVLEMRPRKRFVWARVRSWAPAAAAAVLVLALGMWIGRRWETPSAPSGDLRARLSESPEAEALRLAGDYVARTQALLLGLAHWDARNEDAAVFDLTYQRDASRLLVRQGEELKRTLDTQRHRRLLELVSQLETILLRIAHLNSRGGDPVEIDSIRQGVDDSGVLIGIDLERMRLRSTPSNPRREL